MSAASSAANPLPGLTQAALDFLAGLEGTERALVMTREPEGGLVVRRLHGSLDLHDLASKAAPPGYTFHVVGDSAKSVFSLDITQDPVFAACERRSEGRSVLCVPVPGKAGPCGYLYADHTFKVGAFAHADLRKVEAYAQELGPRLEEAIAAARAAARNPAAALLEDHQDMLRKAAALVLLAFVWAGAGIFLHTVRRPPPPAPSISLETGPANAICSSYLALIRFKNPSAAYDLLSRRAQSKISREKFVHDVALWLNQPANSWEMNYRRPGSAVPAGDTTEVYVEPAPGMKSWTYTFVRDVDKGPWKLDRWDGGPLPEIGTASAPSVP